MLNKNFRVYEIATGKKQRQAVGLWQDTTTGKTYKDNINFYYTPSLLEAKQKAKTLLNTTSEICIAVESIHPKTLYLIYKDKTEVLSFYKSVNVKYKILSKRITQQTPCYTIEKTSRGNFIFAYGHQKTATKKTTTTPKATGNVYIQGQLI